MSKDAVNTTIEQLRTALDEYKAQPNPETSHRFHLRIGGSPFHVKQAEYLAALGAAVLAIGEEIRRLPAHETV